MKTGATRSALRRCAAAVACTTTAAGATQRLDPELFNTPVTLAAAPAEASFTDVPANADYAEAVAWCKENGLMNGVSDTSFAPDSTLTRAMLVTSLYRAEGEPAVSKTPEFTDTQADTWYSNAVVWANGQGVVQGYGNDLFGTDDPVSAEQMEVILDRYTGEGPEWVGDPARAHAALRSQVAVALYEALAGKTEDSTPNDAPTSDRPVVYMTTDISPEGLMAIYEALDGQIVYISVMNRLSVDCDCDDNPAEPDMHDIGILASYDPVALDQACVDLVYAAEDGQSFINRIESRNGVHTLEQAEKIGLGSREYNLVSIG